ncbi:low molecular weight protein arginine phosphatase [Virgibacillus xinjiangensis]|uniref:Low molecular weight protein arginine phosphatase n=1 Tax=Virgibacillus xinjiangensis TaxID=393090 RepID=A0ABV7CT80_9BACI
MKILFVCTGNTCRSPMAEALLKKKVPDAEVQSAGIFAGKNQRANINAIQALKEKGVDAEHLSQPVTSKLLQWADIVLTMTTQHKQSLIMEYPNFQDKYFTLKEYVSDTDRKVWEQLKKAYADYEMKRSLFIQENEMKFDNKVLDRKLREHLQEDAKNIQRLEADLINYDISDPFGGDLSIYQDTLAELEKHIDMLIEKTE